MFPSLLVQPEVSALSPFVAYFILSIGFLIARAKKILMLTLLALLLAAPSAKAYVAIDSACRTTCFNQIGWWGQPMFYPGAYLYPALVPPWMYYSSPTSYYSMYPPWYSYYGNPYLRRPGIQ